MSPSSSYIFAQVSLIHGLKISIYSIKSKRKYFLYIVNTEDLLNKETNTDLGVRLMKNSPDAPSPEVFRSF